MAGYRPCCLPPLTFGAGLQLQFLLALLRRRLRSVLPLYPLPLRRCSAPPLLGRSVLLLPPWLPPQSPSAASAPAACVPHALSLLVRRSLQVLGFPRVCPKLSPGSGKAQLTVRKALQRLGQMRQPAYPNTRFPPTPHWDPALS